MTDPTQRTIPSNILALAEKIEASLDYDPVKGIAIQRDSDPEATERYYQEMLAEITQETIDRFKERLPKGITWQDALRIEARNKANWLAYAPEGLTWEIKQKVDAYNDDLRKAGAKAIRQLAVEKMKQQPKKQPRKKKT